MIKFDHNRVLMLRDMKGLSVPDFAKEIGVPKQLVYVWERGTSNPSLKGLEKICNKYNVPVQFFFPTVITVSDKEIGN